MKRFLKFSAVVFAVLFLLTGVYVLNILNRYDDFTEREQFVSFAMNLDILNYTEEEIKSLDKLNALSLRESYECSFSEIKDEETARKAACEIFRQIGHKYYSCEEEDINAVYSEKHDAWFALYGASDMVILKAENAEAILFIVY
ncbi:MAG: hypothetical protein IKM38_01045 [Christensenellaceae bacterium]|nr:hypothetical protein [Christensenellaceae bacterium]